MCVLSVDKENVWKDVCNMDDEIPVNYDTIEQLFCQKEISKSTTDAPVHKVIPTKVGLYILHLRSGMFMWSSHEVICFHFRFNKTKKEMSNMLQRHIF